jgi:serine/threonine protein kinase/tetratricopeptide (TPR) repeat protein
MLGRYEIRSLLGTGGMGEVYLSYDTQLRRQIAIKLLPTEFTQDRVRLSRFEREAYAASSLNHPNILTIHEIGQHDGHHFIATEYVEGESLRQRMSSTRIELREVLDVAQQVASALAAAHQAGIVHRDIKPDNIMLRRDGLIKVLDFGLAKLVDDRDAAARSEGIETEAPTKTRVVNTEPGLVMGTASYMSPEQARGLGVDARTDIWSLGVVLYEMVAGRLPFEGTTTSDVIATILHREPPSLLLYRSDMPPEVERIVEKTLTKEREERYQLAKDLGLDLKRLKQRLQVEAELERSITPEEGTRRASTRLVAGSGRPTISGDTGAGAAKQTAEASAAHTTSSAEYIVSEIKRHKKSAALVLVGVIVATSAAIFFYFKSASALTEKDTILLADFINTTGDAVFDGTLKQGLAVQLAQSPFLNIFPDARVRQTLRLMGRSPDDRVTKEVAREICQRQGLKAFLSGSITNLGTSYVITLEAVNGQSGEEMAREQVEAESKEQVLKALSQAASKLREKLGESLQSIQKFDAPLEVTTSSLEALKAVSLGQEQADKGKFVEAIPLYKRAVELDPNFAYAYTRLAVQYYNTNQPGLGAEYAAKAFALRDRASEIEKLRISTFYYTFFTGELDKAMEVLELNKQSYPRDFRAPSNLSDRYLVSGQFEKAAEAAREALRLNPNTVVPYGNLGYAFIGLSRFAEAKEVYGQALQQKLDTTDFHTGLYQIAFVDGDAVAMKQQLDWISGKPDEYVALDWQTQTAAFVGQYRRSQEFSRRAIDLAVRSDAKEVAARYGAEEALRGAVFGQCQQTKADTAQALTLERNTVSLTRSALALALCGEASEAKGQAQPLIDELMKRYPKDTLINSIWLPVIRAAIEINRNNPAQAAQLLEATRRYEAAAEFWPAYLRGQAYLRQQKGAEAAVEFEKVLDHRGEAPLSALYPLAHLGLARAAALTGDAAKARTAYQNFLALWKDADPDIPILLEAKREYAQLR